MKKVLFAISIICYSCQDLKQTVYPEVRVSDAHVKTSYISTLTKSSNSEITINELLNFARMIHGNEVSIENIRRENRGRRMYYYTFDVVTKK